MKNLSTTARRLLGQLATRGHAPAPGLRWETGGPRVLPVRDALLRMAALEGSRVGTLPEAMGLALGGARAVVFLDGPELDGQLDVLAALASRNLSVVVHLEARARGGPGTTAGSGHEAIHAAAEAGAVVLTASEGQEAVDLSLVARLVAEDALCPVVLALDVETASGVENVILPEEPSVRALLGDETDLVHPSGFSQEILFSAHRRRVPAWHDLDRPLLTGAAMGPGVFLRAEAARLAYLTPHRREALDRALRAVGEATGRPLSAVRDIDVRGAHVLLVAQGALVERAVAAARALRHHGPHVGVVGLTALRPFPAAALTHTLVGVQSVIVLERLAAEGGDPPLTRDIRACLASAAGEKTLPRVATVLAGLGGSPVRVDDLADLIKDLESNWRSPVVLGIDFGAPTRYPKRQVLEDALRRNYPEAGRLGSRRGATTGAKHGPALSVGFHRVQGMGGDAVTGSLAALLHRVHGGHVRGRLAPAGDSWGGVRIDRLVWDKEPVEAPEAGTAIGVAVWAAPGLPPRASVLADVPKGGALLVPYHESFWSQFPVSLRREIAARELRVYAARGAEGALGAFPEETLLGAVTGLLLAEGTLAVTRRKLVSGRTDLLAESLPELSPADRDLRSAAFQAGLDLVSLVEPAPESASEPERGDEAEIPAHARQIAGTVTGESGRGEDTLGSLPGFWDRVGVSLRRDEADALAPDPYLATGALPAGTALFKDGSRALRQLPAWDPALCTGCGVCWSACPDSAILATVLPSAALLETGIRLARERGRSGEALRVLGGKLTAAITAEAASRGSCEVSILFREAYRTVSARVTLSEERRAAATEALDTVAGCFDGRVLAWTRSFFEEPEQEAAGTGELLALALNPDACKGCNLCVAVCEPKALVSLPVDAGRIAASREAWRFLHELPETSETTRVRAAGLDDVGPLAAQFLSRESNFALLGGDGAEPGSGEKIAARQVLGLALAHLKSNVQQTVQDLETWRDKISETIRTQLSGALPLSDLDALAQGLSTLGQPNVDLASLTARFEESVGTGRVDVVRLRRLVEAAREIADLHWRFTQGSSGIGRARLGILVAPGTAAAWAGSFPDNPFLVPVTLDTVGRPFELAHGLLHTHLEETLAVARALRRARVELERPGEAPHAIEAMARLSWEDLDPEERRRAAPLFLLGDTDSLRGNAWVARLAASHAPLKILVFTPGFDPDGGVAEFLPGPGQVVVSTSIAHPRHLTAGVAAALEHQGPAWIRVHAPSPGRHGFAADATLARARAAVDARVHPLVVVSPAEPGPDGLPLRVNLDGNPSPGQEWGAGDDGAAITPAEWMRGEARFAGFPDAVRATEQAHETWRFLRAFAAPPAAVSAAPASIEITDARLHELAAGYEARLAAVRVEVQTQMAHRVHERLLSLVRRGGNGKGVA